MKTLIITLFLIALGVTAFGQDDLVPYGPITLTSGETGFYGLTIDDQLVITNVLELGAVNSPERTTFTILISPDANGDGVPEISGTYVAPPTTPDPPTFDPFDVNQDGNVNWSDLTALFKHLFF